MVDQIRVHLCGSRVCFPQRRAISFREGAPAHRCPCLRNRASLGPCERHRVGGGPVRSDNAGHPVLRRNYLLPSFVPRGQPAGPAGVFPCRSGAGRHHDRAHHRLVSGPGVPAVGCDLRLLENPRRHTGEVRKAGNWPNRLVLNLLQGDAFLRTCVRLLPLSRAVCVQRRFVRRPDPFGFEVRNSALWVVYRLVRSHARIAPRAGGSRGNGGGTGCHGPLRGGRGGDDGVRQLLY